MRNDVLIRKAVSEDTPRLCQMEWTCPEGTRIIRATELLPQADFHSLLTGSRGYYGVEGAREVLVADLSGEAVGVISCTLERVEINGKETKAVYLGSLKVSPDRRRKGIAVFLLDFAEKWARSKEAQVVWAGIVEGNQAAEALFQSCGWEKVSRIAFKALPLRFISLNHSIEQAARIAEGWFVPVERRDLEAQAYLEGFWKGHQFWKQRDFPYSTQRYAWRDREKLLACADVFEHFRLARVVILGERGLPRWANLGFRLAARPFQRFVYIRNLAFEKEEYAEFLVSQLIKVYRGAADIMVVGGDAKDSSQSVLRRFRGISAGSVNIFAKSFAEPLDDSRPCHMLLG